MVEGLAGARPLPPTSLLRAWPDLEAAALRALDLSAPSRMAAVFHADDPVLLASSRGEAQFTVDLCAAWAFREKVAFHVGADKTVVLVGGGEAAVVAAESARLWFSRSSAARHTP